MAIVGLILSFVSSIPIVLLLFFGKNIPLPFDSEIMIVIMLVVTLISFFLVGFSDCLSLSWRIMSAGLRVGGLAGLIAMIFTFMIGGFIVIGIPIIITGMVFINRLRGG